MSRDLAGLPCQELAAGSVSPFIKSDSGPSPAPSRIVLS
jgi:hypothetical protein